ncbi:MAG: glycerate kinase [Acidimicrobiales bacterium]|nr:glycerate kinase [Acidimicrobiales bacterium]
MTRRRVVVAPDKFKGTATAAQIAEAMAGAVQAAGATAVVVPMADGGEGTLAAFGGANRTRLVAGPLGDPVDAPWRLDRGVAVLEMAAASGLTLVGGPEENDPLTASTTGTGELIAHAAECGAEQIIVGVGGSASTDGGFGALRAMYPLARFRGVDLVVACDVRTRFVDAAATFAPQKGASPAQVKLLERRLERLAQVYREEHGVDVEPLLRAGAAGGLAGGLAVAGARLVDGFDVVADHVGLYDAIETADLVLTGEGGLDSTSFDGKVVGGVVSFAEAAGVPVAVIAGQAEADGAGRVPTRALVEQGSIERALAEPTALVTEVLAAWLPDLLAPAG